MWFKEDCSYTDFIATVSIDYERLYKIGGWRYGQTFFNLLWRKERILAEEIRGTKLDPFYLDEISHEHHLKLEEKWNEHNDGRRIRQDNR